jgi:hypothetical protein
MYKGVIWAKCIVEEDELGTFYGMMNDVRMQMSEVIQMYGRGGAFPSESDDVPSELLDMRAFGEG